MHFGEIYERLSAKSSLCFQFHEEGHDIALKKRARIISDYLEIRKHRIPGKQCDNCYSKSARDDFGTTVNDIVSYHEVKGKDYHFCSEGCMEQFGQDFSYCECGELYQKADMVYIGDCYCCKICAADNIIEDGLSSEHLEEWDWLEDFLMNASKNPHWRKIIKRDYEKIGWTKEWERIKKAFKYVDSLNPLIIPTKRGWNFYISRDRDIDLESDILATNVYLLIKNINNKTYKHA